MDKNKLSQNLNRAFGEKTVNVIMPKQFLANLSKIIEQQNKEISEVIAEKGKMNEALLKELVGQQKIAQELFVNLEQAIRESRVDRVEIDNFPEQKEIKIPETKIPEYPEYPKEIDVKKPKWYERFSDAKILKYIKEGFEWNAKQEQKVNLDKYQDKKEALAVRLVDKSGKTFYDAITQAIAGGIASPLDTHMFYYCDMDNQWESVKAHHGNLTIMSHLEHETVKGHSFYASTFDETLADEEGLILAFKTDPTQPMFFDIHAWGLLMTHIQIYEGRTWTAGTGTQLDIFNRNRNSVNTSTVWEDTTGAFLQTNHVIEKPAPNADGTLIVTHYFAGKQIGARIDIPLFLELKLDQTYVIYLASNKANNSGELGLSWHEHE